MSLLPDEEIGMEVHRVDQFFRVEQGEGLAIIRGKRYHIKDGTGLVVPAGTYHNIINISKYKELKLYTIYCPPEHPVGERELYKS
jgi:mannose-6-phosphate isomerase-like protein (cupin superfamily)